MGTCGFISPVVLNPECSNQNGKKKVETKNWKKKGKWEKSGYDEKKIISWLTDCIQKFLSWFFILKFSSSFATLWLPYRPSSPGLLLVPYMGPIPSYYRPVCQNCKFQWFRPSTEQTPVSRKGICMGYLPKTPIERWSKYHEHRTYPIACTTVLDL